jgi:hypothetical protein
MIDLPVATEYNLFTVLQELEGITYATTLDLNIG